MKTYIFSGYFLNGCGSVYALSSWSLGDADYFLPHHREIVGNDLVEFDFSQPEAGMFKVRVKSDRVKSALDILRLSLISNRLSLVLSCNYTCISNGRASSRILRLPLDLV